MPINASYEYLNAEKEYLAVHKLEDKIYWLEEMIRVAPKHKSSEKFLAELKTRLRKFREKAEKARKKSGGKKGIRKEGFQFVLIGKTNSGKSSLLQRLTNANPLIGDYEFTTSKPEIGTFEFDGVRAQVIDLPSIGSDNFDIGIVNTADCLMIVVEKLEELDEVGKVIERVRGKRLIVVNKIDLTNEIELRKLRDRLKSKRIEGVLISALTGEGIGELREKMFLKMGVIRVFTKEPSKLRAEKPMVLQKGATVKDAAEEILKGFSLKVKETRLTGPSGKFKNQRVGLRHKLEDRDTIEFHTR